VLLAWRSCLSRSRWRYRSRGRTAASRSATTFRIRDRSRRDSSLSARSTHGRLGHKPRQDEANAIFRPRRLGATVAAEASILGGGGCARRQGVGGAMGLLGERWFSSWWSWG
jgi:hypothetical protein